MMHRSNDRGTFLIDRFYDVAGRIIGADGADTAPHAICLAALKVAKATPGETVLPQHLKPSSQESSMSDTADRGNAPK